MAMATTVNPRIHNAWGSTLAPKICTGTSGVRGGRAMRFLPQTILMIPRRMMDRPTVRKMSTRWLSERAGRRPTRSTTMAATATRPTARIRAGIVGRPRTKRAENMNMPPRVTKSTWMKLTMPMVLLTTQKPRAIRA